MGIKMSNENEITLYADKLHEITYKKETKVVMIQDLTNGYFINLPNAVFVEIFFQFERLVYEMVSENK